MFESFHHGLLCTCRPSARRAQNMTRTSASGEVLRVTSAAAGRLHPHTSGRSPHGVERSHRQKSVKRSVVASPLVPVHMRCQTHAAGEVHRVTCTVPRVCIPTLLGGARMLQICVSARGHQRPLRLLSTGLHGLYQVLLIVCCLRSIIYMVCLH